MMRYLKITKSHPHSLSRLSLGLSLAAIFIACTLVLFVSTPESEAQVISQTAAAPSNPDLSPSARNVLNYICSVKGNGILSGQQEAEWVAGLSKEMNEVYQLTGKYPAIRGFDSMLTPNPYKCQDPTNVSIASWKDKGHIIQWSWHMGAPIAGYDPIATDDYDASKLTVDINKVLTAGTAENKNFITKLDAQAARLQKLEDQNVPVLWRPYHEMNGNWFWWNKSGPDAYKRLWIFTHDYFTKTKGLNNLIWVWSTIRGADYGEGSPIGSYFYPGDAYVDIVGGDLYSHIPIDWPRFTNAWSSFTNLAPTKVAAISEAGAIPDPTELKNKGLHYVWFLPWHTQYVDRNSADYLKYVYNHAYTITLDELPDLKSASASTPAPLPTAIPTANPTAIPTAIPTTNPTALPVPTSTPVPVLTPAPSPTSTPVSTPVPQPSTTPSPVMTMTIPTYADTFVTSESPYTNYNGSTSISIDGAPTKITLLRFDFVKLAGYTLRSAQLKIKTTGASDAGSPSTQFVRVAKEQFNHEKVNYYNKPPLSAVVSGKISSTNPNSIYTIPLTVSELQPYAGNYLPLAIAADSQQTDGLHICTRESSCNRAELTVTYSR